MKKLNNKKSYKIPKYNLGGLTKFGENGQANAQSAAGLVGMASGFMKQGSRGQGAVSGASAGASAGAALGPIGMGVGAVLGGTLGLLAAGKADREAKTLARNDAIATSKTYGQNFITDNNNQNAFGTQMFKDGGSVKKNNKVLQLQKQLLKGNYLKDQDIDGLYGPITDKAYQKFEKENTGFFGKNMSSKVLPLSVNALANDLTGRKRAISRDTLSDNELKELQTIVRSNLKKGKTTIEYPDYGTGTPYGDVGGKEKSSKTLIKIGDPKYNLKTTLGQANIFVNGSDTLVLDSYDFNDANDPKRGIKNFGKQIVENPSLYNISRKAGSNFGSKDGEGAPIIINTNDKKKYADGAEVMQNQINIEKGELQIDPNSGKILREYKGINPETGGLYEPHKKKGKDTNNNIVSAEEDTFIITKAKATDYKKAVDNNDKLHLESIKMNIKNNKDAKMGTYKMGSYVKYADGSRIKPGKGWSEQVKTNMNPIGNFGIGNISQFDTTPYNLKNVGTPYQTAPTVNNQQSFNLSNAFNTAAQYAPALMNIGQGLFGKTETMARVQPQVNPFQNDVLSNMPEEISSQPLVDELNRNMRGQFKNINNSTSGSPIARANKNSVFASSQDKLADIRINNQMMNNQIRGQRGSIFNGLGQQRIAAGQQAEQMNFQIDNINAQNRGMKDQRLNQGLSQLQETYMNNKSNKRTQDLDMYKNELLGVMFPNVKFNDLFSSDMLSKIGRKK